MSRWPRFTSMALAMALAAAGALAQVPSEGDTTTPPLATPGHALIVGPHEMVNPANGSVSLTFPVNIPPGRKLTLPFNIMYSSNGARFVTNSSGGVGWQTEAEPYLYEANGWSYGVPKLSSQHQSIQVVPNPDGTQCSLYTNFVYTDPSGQPHALGLSFTSPNPSNNPCTNWFPDPQLDTSFSENCPSLVGNPTVCAGEGPLRAWTPNGRAVTLFDPSGATYSFDGAGIAQGVWDRNGNYISLSVDQNNNLTETDTLGRPAVVTSGFNSGANTISVYGTSGYTLTWGTAPFNFTESPSNLSTEQDTTCNVNLTAQGTAPVVTSLTTPDGTYQFQYDPTYGLLNKIIYPNGGYVRYVWALTTNSEFGEFAATPTGNWVYNPGPGDVPECSFNYGVPMITDRFVSSDGSTEQEHQNFAYTFGASTRQTTVTTYDQVAGTSYVTTYNYNLWTIPAQPNSALQVSTFMPVESSVVYQDLDGSTLRTVNEQWTGMPLVPTDRQTVLDPMLHSPAQVSDIQTKYNDYLEPTEQDEYEYGEDQPGPLARQTLTTYQSFDDTNQSLSDVLDRPSTVTINDGSGDQMAETAYGYDGSAVGASGVTVGNDSNYVGHNARANLTSVSRWLNPGNRSLTTYLTNDDTGQIVSSKDPNGNVTGYSYADNFSGGGQPGITNAYVTQVTPPTTVGCPQGVNCHIESYSYFYAGGQMASHTDANSNITSYAYNDPWGRLTQINFPDGGETTYAYTPSTLETQRLMTSGRFTEELDTFDGIGRPVVSAHTNGNGDYDRTETCFDGFGNVSYTTYPFESSSEGGGAACTSPGDAYVHDALARMKQTKHADGSSVNLSYSGSTTTTADEGNGSGSAVTRIADVDALGNLASVCEVGPGRLRACGFQSGSPTNYSHDALGNLTEVIQGSLTRTFTYDSLSRLLTASNPEAGTTSYTWDDDGNLASQTKANGVAVNYSVDALNRQTGRSFTINGQPDPADTVTLSYDTDPTGIATYGAYDELTRVANGSPVVLSFNQYDPMGRAQVLDTIVSGTTYHTSMSFDGIGFPTYEQLTSGRQLYLDEDPAGRTSWIGDASFPGDGQTYYPYIADRYYTSWGAPSDEDLGNGSHQGWHTDSRMRTTEVDVHPTGDYNYNDYQMDEDIAYNPDSSVASITDALGSAAESYTFTMDQLGRLSGWSNGAGLNCTLFADQYGNTGDSSGNPSCGLLTGVSFNNQNQIVGWVYDASGEPLSDTTGTSYAWNVEGQLSGYQQTGQPAVNYVYDGLGRRVEKLVNGAVTATYFRNAAGDVTSELDGSVFTDSILSPSDGVRIARVVGAGGVSPIYFYHPDPLGTTRAITDGNGNNIADCGQNASYPNGSFLTYAPFGAELADCTQSTEPYKFTGKYRDAESGLDDFGARYLQSSLGRFLSPDNQVVPNLLDEMEPQRLNLYSYAVDSPEQFVDPSGHDAIAVDFTGMAYGFGHEGIIVVRPDGSATYASFGPDPAGQVSGTGQVKTYDLDRIDVGADGLPTASSWRRVAQQVAGFEGQKDPAAVRMNYFATTQAGTQALDAFIKETKKLSDARKLPRYNAFECNCANYAVAGLFASGAIANRSVSSLPNMLFEQLQIKALESWASGKATENDKDKPCVTVSDSATGYHSSSCH